MVTKSGKRTKKQSTSPDRLLKTAERLFAERGLDAVSLRLISREAGDLNTASVHYYFGTREALIDAVLARRLPAINARREAAMAALDAAGGMPELRDVLACHIRSLADEMTEGQGGGNYARFIAQAYASTEFDIAEMANRHGEKTFRRVAEMARPLLPHLPADIFRERIGIMFRTVVYVFADWERDRHASPAGGKRLPIDIFTEDLIDTQTAALSAPCSRAEDARTR